jgi:hypothetical protein
MDTVFVSLLVMSATVVMLCVICTYYVRENKRLRRSVNDLTNYCITLERAAADWKTLAEGWKEELYKLHEYVSKSH